MVNRRELLAAGEIYHLYNRGNRKAEVFRDEDDYRFALRRLRGDVIACSARITAYCLMPNHFHLLASCTTDDGLSRLMQRWITSLAKTTNLKYGLVGHLFQGRFNAKRITTTEHLLCVARYIHMNPVTGRLVGDPAEWPFSSYAETIGMTALTVSEPDALLACMVPELMASAAAQVTGDTRSEAQRRYRDFVRQYHDDDAVLEAEREWDRDTSGLLPGSRREV